MYIYKLYILTLYFYICRYEMTELRKRNDNDIGFVDQMSYSNTLILCLNGKLNSRKIS